MGQNPSWGVKAGGWIAEIFRDGVCLELPQNWPFFFPLGANAELPFHLLHGDFA
jgi:hypothetical protein